jgi:hypothetical protein
VRTRGCCMIASLVLPELIAQELEAAALNAVETAGVLMASVARPNDSEVRLLARKIRWVDEGAYLRREHDALSISSEGYVSALSEADALGATCLWVHTHPGFMAIPRSSERDDIVDGQISDVFRIRSGSSFYGTLILSPRASGVTFTGYIEGEGHRIPIERLWRAGDRLRLTHSFDAQRGDTAPIFDRNVRAFGASIQHTLSDLRVGIVGCGGTGSAVAEQLTRLGVRKFVLVDPDTLASSNITRVYGSTPDDVGANKTDILSKHLKRIAPEIFCENIVAMLTTESAARRLIPCDVVFGCTDDNAGRLVLSRLATYFLTPVIDCGILLSSDASGQLVSIDGRITTCVPGGPCLVCRGRIDLRRAGTELLTPAERVRREDEGYAPALGRTEPAVVAFTTMVAATAVSELLERLIGYGPDPRPTEVLLRIHEREISTNAAQSREGHYCHPLSGKLGIGMTEPFLEQLWPTLN